MSARMVALLASWLVLGLIPRRKVGDAVRGLLRCYGRWMARTTPALRNLKPARLVGSALACGSR